MEDNIKSKQAVQYNQRLAAKELSDLLPGDQVYLVPYRIENAVGVSLTPELRPYLGNRQQHYHKKKLRKAYS